MKCTYHDQIDRAVGATRVTPNWTFTWFGQPSGVTPRDGEPATVARQHLQGTLQQRLYRDFYLSGGAVARRRERTALPVTDARTFVAGLESANTGSGTWSSGWTELHRHGDTVVVHDERLDLALWVTPADVCHHRDGGVSLRLPAQLPDWSPGFWLALGNAPFGDRTEPQVRFYWNMRPDGAAMLVSEATKRLNDAGIPFRLKVLADPSRYTRCDAGVLYLPEQAVKAALPIVQAVYAQVRHELKPAVPALTKRLAPGLATADDPGGNESFGSQRCRLLASAIVAAAEAGLTRLPDRVAFVAEHLAANGVSLEQPYACSVKASRTGLDVTILPESSPVEPSTARPTEVECRRVAIDIATHIAGDAFWDSDGCTWLGSTGTFERGQPVYGTLGPDLYNGAAGIALFLGDVFRATGDETFASAALGGIRYALTHAGDVPTGSIAGFYTGLPGIAFAAARLAGILDRPDLLADAGRLLDGIDAVPSRERDLLSGTAGAVQGVLLLNRIAPDERRLSQAILLGDQLLESAHRSAAGYSWRSGRRALTGLSHGASGIGVALLELAIVTGEDRFFAGARAAVAWERQFFNSDEGNWPDLRQVTGRAPRSSPLPAGMSWCHGAPGIALARLRAARLLGDQTLRDEARIALATTRQWIDDALGNGDESFCLCHGLAGNAEILLDGYAALGDDRLRDTALAVAAAGIDRYAPDPFRWPCGTYDGNTPGLMLGLAGIGRFYLRLADPTVPSILLPVASVAPVDG